MVEKGIDLATIKVERARGRCRALQLLTVTEDKASIRVPSKCVRKSEGSTKAIGRVEHR